MGGLRFAIQQSRGVSMLRPHRGLILAAMLGGLVISVPAQMFRGNLRHTGEYDGPGISVFSKVKWKFATHGQVIASPAVAEQTAYFGSTDGIFYAVDIETGSLKWKFETHVRITSSAAVDNGTVYFESYDGNLYALTASTGQLKWKFATAGERRFAGKHLHGSQPAGESMPDPFDFYLSSPAVWNGAVYFGSGDGNIYALDVNTGATKWKFATGNVVHASPAIADGVVFIGSWDSFFYALDAATGKERWRLKTGEDTKISNQVGIQSSAAVADGVVYFGCRDSKLYAVDANTGKQKWVFNNKGSWVIGSPAVHAGKVYFSTSDSGLFYSVDAKTGAQLSSAKYIWPMFSSPAISGNILYIGSHDGKLRAIDLVTNNLAWTFQTDGSKENGAALTNEDGSPKYEAAFTDDFYDNMVAGVAKMMTVGTVLSSPVVANGVIYFGSTDGNLYAVR
jgi:outer membrane protein assembly factor BamB